MHDRVVRHEPLKRSRPVRFHRFRERRGMRRYGVCARELSGRLPVQRGLRLNRKRRRCRLNRPRLRKGACNRKLAGIGRGGLAALFERLFARDPEPRRRTAQRAVHRRLHHGDLDLPVLHARRTLKGVHPDAHHVRLHLAESSGAHAAAGAVAQILGAVHGAGHAGRRKHALAAHLAVEQQALEHALGQREGPFQALIADALKHRVERHHHALQVKVELLEKARMAYSQAS